MERIILIVYTYQINFMLQWTQNDTKLYLSLKNINIANEHNNNLYIYKYIYLLRTAHSEKQNYK